MNSRALSYTEEWLQVDRPQPLSDLKIERTFGSIINGDWNPDVTDQVYEDFKLECENWIFSTKLNTLTLSLIHI